jgi:hypothetical protein
MAEHDEIEDRLDEDSERLLAAADELRKIEMEKRQAGLSSPKFHELAEVVEQKSRAVFRIATRQRQDGDRLSGPRDTTIAEIDRENEERRKTD